MLSGVLEREAETKSDIFHEKILCEQTQVEHGVNACTDALVAVESVQMRVFK